MRKFWVAVIAAIALMVGAVAWAAIPHSTTSVITGCYHNTNGSLRVIDAQAGATCNSNETQLQWNDEHVHHQWARTVSQSTGPVVPNDEREIRALCPLNEIALGGHFQNRDPNNLTIVLAGDWLPSSGSDLRKGFRAVVIAGPNGSSDSIGVSVTAQCGVHPDL